MRKTDETIHDPGSTKSGGSSTILDNAEISSVGGSDASERAEDICYEKGTTILDTYRVKSDAIVSGGMGRVWRVHHTGWNVDLAMKRPRAEFFSGEKSKLDFINECDTWINLGLHPNIVSCYYVRLIDDIPTIFSEWMDGGDLAHAINSGSLYEDFHENPAQVQKRILDIAIQFARGLHYAHESRDESGKTQNLIHRDVKPGNVLLSKSGEVKVSDFGLTKSVTRPPQGTPAGDAEASCFKGTLVYCSMEQMDEKPLTQRTDLYSWAVSVMELYVGGHPWANGVVAGLNCQQYFSEAQIPIPAPMTDLLERCLASEPDDRPHDFGLVIAELRAIYRMETGEDYPREASKAAADTADSLNNRALSMLDIGKREEAEKLWERTLKLSQAHMEGLYNSSLYRWRSGLLSDEEAYLRVQLGSAYYAESESGKEALSTFTREAGKKTCFEPLFTDQPAHEISRNFVCSIDARHKSPVLWHGKLYLVVGAFRNAPSEKIKDRALYIYDAKTGDCLDEIYFDEIRKEYGDISDISLSPDAEIAIITVFDCFIYYELSHLRVKFTFQKGIQSIYNSHGPFAFLGKQHRYAYRMRSCGIGHAPPTTEVWDFEAGAMINYANEYKLMDADDALSQRHATIAHESKISDEEPRWNVISFTDGLRLIPSVLVEGNWYRCDPSGLPLYPMNAKISDFLDNGNRIVLRIHGLSSMWMQDRRSIVEWDAQSGKCLRSYRLDPGRNDVLIDEDGLSCVRIRIFDDKEQNHDWQYRVLPKIIPESQAQWQLSKIGSHQEMMQQEQTLQALGIQFDHFCSLSDGVSALFVYREAVGIPSFVGSALQQRLTSILDVMPGVRQVCTAALMANSATIDEGESIASFADLNAFGLANPTLSPAFANKIKHSPWIQNHDSCISNLSASPDGKLLLIYGQGEDSTGNAMRKIGSVCAPLGSGIYVLDAQSERLYFLTQITPSGYAPSAQFSKDMSHVVLKNGFYDRNINALAVFHLRSGRTICVTRVDRARHSLYIEPDFEGKSTALIWEGGVFLFQNNSELDQFVALEGGNFHVLDADKQKGLIVYCCENERTNDTTVYIWDVVQRKHVLEVIHANAKSILAAKLSFDGHMMLLATHESRKTNKWELYQLGYSYEVGEKRCFPLLFRSAPRLDLQPCEWPTASPVPAATPPKTAPANPTPMPAATATKNSASK